MLRILKIGGNVLADPDALDQALSFFASFESPAILVHGGGREASELLKKMGHEAKMMNGRRLTDAATLEVVTMVYAGLINKKLVAQLQAKNCNALGVSGADGNLIQAHKRIVKEIDYGFAGDIDAINTAGFKSLLEGGFSPVCCAITHDKQAQLLNTNADTIASSIAVALAADYEVELQYCFEKPGVLMDADNDESVIEHIDPSKYEMLKEEGVVHSGMLPKLDNAFAAIGKGVKAVYVGNLESLGNGKATRLSL